MSDSIGTTCGDSSCEMLVSPMPVPKAKELSISVRPRKREVMLVDNRKPNSLHILRRAKELLEARGVKVLDIGDKVDASRPFESQVLDRLATEDGLILLGVSD